MPDLLLGLAVLLSFLFGWNNSSFLIGNLRGSGVLSLRGAAVVSVVGLAAGALLEGPKMTTSLSGSLAPATSEEVLAATLAVSIALTLGLTLLKLPVSFSMVMVGAFLGGTVSAGLAVSSVRPGEVVAFWFVAPMIAAAITFALYASVARLLPRFGLLTVDTLNRVGAVAGSLAVSYALGANNLGLIYGSMAEGNAYQPEEAIAVLALAAVAGLVAFGGGGVSGTLGDRMLSLSPQGVICAFMGSSVVVWAATQLAVPISIGQCLLGAMIGAAYTKNVTVLNGRLVVETVSVWVLAPLLAFASGYLLVAV